MNKYKAGKRKVVIACIIAVIFFCFGGIFKNALTEDEGGLPHYCATEIPGTEIGCHTLMKPEYRALKNGVHAKVKCTDCHIGGDPFLGIPIFSSYWWSAKANGAWNQLPQTVFGSYSTPIKVPIHNLNPVEDTCGVRCHEFEKVKGRRIKDKKHFMEDKNNTTKQNLYTLFLGSGVEGEEWGIHKHSSKDFIVEYVSEDNKRKKIQWVKLKYRKGPGDEWKTKEWARAGFNNESQQEYDDEHAQEVRKMDCYDCHNRVGHDMLTLDNALDKALQKGLEARESGLNPSEFSGALDPRIPYIKKIAKTVLEEESGSIRLIGEKAVAAGVIIPSGGSFTQIPTFTMKLSRPNVFESALVIDSRIKEFYRDNYSSLDPERLDSAIDTIVELYMDNVDSDMMIKWGTYPSHIGHEAIPGQEDYSKKKTERGCYRCHNEELKPIRGTDTHIFNKCEKCHEMHNQFGVPVKP